MPWAGIILIGVVSLLIAFSGSFLGDTTPAWFAAIMAVVAVGFLIFGDKIFKVSEIERKLWMELILLVAGAGIIAVGADLLVEHGQVIALGLGVPATVVALLFVALGTSLPELVTTITSLKKGRASLGVGNVIGANVFNLVLDIPVILGVMILMIAPAMIKKKLSRWQGFVLLGIYIAFCICQFTL